MGRLQAWEKAVTNSQGNVGRVLYRPFHRIIICERGRVPVVLKTLNDGQRSHLLGVQWKLNASTCNKIKVEEQLSRVKSVVKAKVE